MNDAMNDNAMIARYKAYEPFFGSWYIKRFVGEGSFAKVFEIVRSDFGNEYTSALKVITISKTKTEIDAMKAEGMSEKDIRENLRGIVEDTIREIQFMYQLRGNGNIVGYEDHALVEHEDGIGWDILIKMEYLTSLDSYIESHNGKIAKRDVIKLGIDICKALEVCQKYNIIHRDIKADNIFISNTGDFKLGDFGIARIIERKDMELSRKGTSAYMAPEVYQGLTYTSAVDIYSLGIVLYRLFNHNRGPFLPDYPKPIGLDERDRALMRRMSGEEFPKPLLLNTGRLSEIVLKACAYRPEERYLDPVSMRRELEAVLYDKSEVTDEDMIMIYEKQQDGAASSNHNETAESYEYEATEVLREEVPDIGPQTDMGAANAGVVNILCPKCGNTMNRDAAFCPACGASQRELQAGTKNQKTAGQSAAYKGSTGKRSEGDSSKKIAVIAGICAVAVVLAGVFIGVRINTSSDKNSDKKDSAVNGTGTLMANESTVSEETQPQGPAGDILNGDYADSYHQDFTAKWQSQGYGSQGWHETFLYADNSGNARHLLYFKPSVETVVQVKVLETALLWEGPVMDDYGLEEDLIPGLYETQNGEKVARLRMLAVDISDVNDDVKEMGAAAMAELFKDVLSDPVAIQISGTQYGAAYQVSSDWEGGATGLIYCVQDNVTGKIYIQEYMMKDAYFDLETAVTLVKSMKCIDPEEYGIDITRGLLGNE